MTRPEPVRPSEPRSISVVVCCYTQLRWDDIVSGLAALGPQLRVDDQVVVVVDHEPELERRLIEQLRDTAQVRVVPNAHAQGLSGARNSGVDASSESDVVAFLDDDALPPPSWLDALRRPFADPLVVGVAGGVSPAWEGGRAPRWFPPEFGWVVGCDYVGLPQGGAPVRNPIGASMALRMSALQAVGGFSELVGRVGTLPVGCEETELSIRLRALDPSAFVVRVPFPPVAHRVPTERQTLRYFRSRCYHEGRSKAVLSGLVGQDAALASERVYATRTLPVGVVRHLLALLMGDLAGPARAAAIIGGLLTTALGYASVRLRPGS